MLICLCPEPSCCIAGAAARASQQSWVYVSHRTYQIDVASITVRKHMLHRRVRLQRDAHVHAGVPHLQQQHHVHVFRS